MYRSRLPRIAAGLHVALDAAVKAGAERVAEDAKERVPIRSGALRDAIHTEDDDGGTYVIAGDSGVFYGHIVEHGGARTPARPFLIPALEENRAGIVAAAAVAVRRL